MLEPKVNAFDVSSAMLAAARERLGSRAELRVARPRHTLSSSRIRASTSWSPHSSSTICATGSHLFASFHRVLKPGGAVVFSTHHPAWDWRNHCPDDYFAFLEVSEVWIPPFPVSFWRRPLSAITATIADLRICDGTNRGGAPASRARGARSRGVSRTSFRAVLSFTCDCGPSSQTGPWHLHCGPWREAAQQPVLNGHFGESEGCWSTRT